MAEVPTTSEIEADIGAMIMGEEPEPEETTEAQTEVPEDESPDVATEDPEEAAEDVDDLPEPEGPSVEGDDDTVEVEFEGQVFEAPKAVAEALMRQSDYTKKTQEVSAERKQLDVQHENFKLAKGQYEFARLVQEDVIKAYSLDQQIEQTRTYLKDNVDSLNYTEMEKIRIAIGETERERDTIISGLTAKNTEFQQAQEQSRQELLKKSTEVLRQKIPGWDEKHEDDLKGYALSLGVPEPTFNSIVDPLEKFILFKAMQYDALKSGVVPAVKKVQNAPTIKTKGRNPMPKDTRQKLDLRNKLASKKLTDKQKERLMVEDFGERLS